MYRLSGSIVAIRPNADTLQLVRVIDSGLGANSASVFRYSCSLRRVGLRRAQRAGTPVPYLRPRLVAEFRPSLASNSAVKGCSL
jgi:hypothetical protein